MKLLTTLCCAAFALCGAIYAQSPDDHIVVHFSTPVMVGETRLPAGDCDIQVMRGSSYRVLVFRSAGAPTIEAVASRLSEADTDTADGTSVILDRRGNDLHLQRIVFSDHTGYQLTNDQ